MATASLFFALLLSAVVAQSNLPVVDLGYRLQRASNYNDTGLYYNFSNIRYAAPPIGKLRFAAPQAPETDRSTPYDGTKEGRICPQAITPWSNTAVNFLVSNFLGTPFNSTPPPPLNASTFPNLPQDPRTSEDCLFLDVVVPKCIFDNAKSGAKAPVLVWIYGGGYVGGSKGDNFDPIGLLKRGNENIVYVALNYRLGALGWLSGPTFQQDGASNAGLRDQRFALEWVQKNIHLFGGDPDKVTVMGESAGGGSIIHQITAYGGHKEKAPFQQAIPQSPAWFPQPSKLGQEKIFNRFLQLANVSSLEEARNLPSDAVIRANAVQVGVDSGYGEFVHGPTVDGDFVPDLPGLLLLHGEFDKSVKVLAGHNGMEGIYFTSPFVQTDSDLRNYLAQKLPTASQDVLDYILNVLYPPVFDGSRGYKNDIQRETAIIQEFALICNNDYLERALGNNSYGYIFNVPPAIHGQDVGYTFFEGDKDTKPPNSTNPVVAFLAVQNTTVAIALQEFITSFVQDGKPNGGGVVPQFDMYGPDAQVVELNATSVGEIKDPASNARCKYWQKALYY